MPVSTTFLLLTSFSTKVTAVGKVLSKSLMGYVLAFVIAMIVWSVASKWMKKILSENLLRFGPHYNGLLQERCGLYG